MGAVVHVPAKHRSDGIHQICRVVTVK